MSTGFLKVNGTKIVNENGDQVVLKGVALGGVLLMENFMTGYAGSETEHKEPLLKVLGKEKFEYFFEKFREYYFTDKDAEFLKSLSMNCIRIAVNYRHFLDDSDLFKIKPEGFKRLDRYVDICTKHQIYCIIDLHAVPGGQGTDQHCDNGLHKAIFWNFGHFQDAAVNLWKVIADHYKDNTWIAGYNTLNEPCDSKHYRLINYYSRVEKAIRSVDPHHILYLDANTYSMDFSHFPEEPFPNSVYAIHDYSLLGFPGHQTYIGSDFQNEKLKKQYYDKITLMKKMNVPVYVGEFGPVYASEFRGDKGVEATNDARYKLLNHQIEMYNHGDPAGDNKPVSWTIWCYKDIGLQGLVYASPTSKWYQLLTPWLKKKLRLGVDKWGAQPDPAVEKLYSDLRDHFREVIPKEHHKALYPSNWTIDDYVNRMTRELLLGQYLGYEFADYFKGLSFEDLDELAASFKFENVEKRLKLNQYLKEN